MSLGNGKYCSRDRSCRHATILIIFRLPDSRISLSIHFEICWQISPPPPPPGLFTCKFSDIDRQNIPVKFKFKLEIDITKHGDYSLGRHASNKRNTKTRRHQFQHSTKYPATGHRGCSVMEHRVFRLRSVNRVAEQERGARLDTTRPRDRERERERRGCFNEIAVMPCKWLGNSFRGFLYPPPDCTPRRLNSIPYIF